MENLFCPFFVTFKSRNVLESRIHYFEWSFLYWNYLFFKTYQSIQSTCFKNDWIAWINLFVLKLARFFHSLYRLSLSWTFYTLQKNPAVSDMATWRTNRFMLKTLCTHLSGSNLWNLNVLLSWICFNSFNYQLLHITKCCTLQ